MVAIRSRWTTFLDDQHRYPTGLAGQLIGERMLRQHMPETTWSVDQLQIQPIDRVLEVGFGAGRAIALAAQQAPHGQVIGIDLSATMIQAAHRRNRVALRARRVALLRGSIAALPFADQQFDKILSIHTLYFWPDPLAICADLVRVLKPGGTLIVTFATAQRGSTGEWRYWPLQREVEALVQQLQQWQLASVTLQDGPPSRQYNNVALVLQK